MRESPSRQIALVRSSYSEFGGAETFALSLIDMLVSSGVAVDVLTLPNQPWPIDHPNLRLVPMGSAHGHRLWQAFRFDRAVQHHLNTHAYQTVFSVDRVSQFTHVSAAGGTHRTFLDIMQQDASIPARAFRWLSLFHRYILWMEKHGFQNRALQKIHCCSQMVADDIQRQYHVDESKLKVIYNSIDWALIGQTFETRKHTAATCINEFGLDPDQKYVLFLGSGFHRKGLDIAIRGLCHLPKSYHLLVIGKGSKRKYRSLASALGVTQRVHFLGAQPHGWRFAALSCGLMLPSRYEPFGLAAAEAQAMGLPVLVSDRTGFSELVRQDVTGVILPLAADKSTQSDIFSRFGALMARVDSNAQEIRDGVQFLDHPLIYNALIDDFLGVA